MVVVVKWFLVTRVAQLNLLRDGRVSCLLSTGPSICDIAAENDALTYDLRRSAWGRSPWWKVSHAALLWKKTQRWVRRTTVCQEIYRSCLLKQKYLLWVCWQERTDQAIERRTWSVVFCQQVRLVWTGRFVWWNYWRLCVILFCFFHCSSTLCDSAGTTPSVGSGLMTRSTSRWAPRWGGLCLSWLVPPSCECLVWQTLTSCLSVFSSCSHLVKAPWGSVSERKSSFHLLLSTKACLFFSALF